ISITKNASLNIQPIHPSLDDLNPVIRKFHTLTKAGIPKNTAGYFGFPIALLDKVSYRESKN
ncbi:14644_t:CDS:2, partial [Gigaspora rosea]